jgi:hypothetical protein
MYFTEYGVLTLAIDKKTTGYEEATSYENSYMLNGMPNYDTTAIALDLSGPDYQFRGGVYSSVPSSDSIEISGTTFGLGITFGALNLEASVDSRTYSYPYATGTESTNELFGSFSINYAFGTKI